VVVCDRETEARLRFNPARKGRRRSYKRQVTPMEMARFSEHAANERKAEGNCANAGALKLAVQKRRLKAGQRGNEPRLAERRRRCTAWKKARR
jgi:hypothetical protein